MQKNNKFEQDFWRFYGRRIGHTLSKRKKTLMHELLPKVSINLQDYDVLDPSEFFKPCAEIWMEIGFGSGEHLAYQAEQNPDIGFIGCEPYVNGVASLLDYIEEKSLSNIRIYANDARILIKKLAPRRLNRVFLLFSDPWPKKRHYSRRFVNYENLDALSRVMKDLSKLQFSSDNNNFVRWSLYQFYKHKDFDWLVKESKDWRKSFDSSIITRYESKATKSGRNCIYLTFQRCKRASDE